MMALGSVLIGSRGQAAKRPRDARIREAEEGGRGEAEEGGRGGRQRREAKARRHARTRAH